MVAIQQFEFCRCAAIRAGLAENAGNGIRSIFRMTKNRVVLAFYLTKKHFAKFQFIFYVDSRYLLRYRAANIMSFMLLYNQELSSTRTINTYLSFDSLEKLISHECESNPDGWKDELVHWWRPFFSFAYFLLGRHYVVVWSAILQVGKTVSF
jgi:hypothetical protein